MKQYVIGLCSLMLLFGCNEKHPDQYSEDSARSVTPRSIVGVVSYGAAASNTELCGSALDESEIQCTTTDASGRYELKGLGEAPFVILRAQTNDQTLLSIYFEQEEGNIANVNELTTVVASSTESKLRQQRLITCNHNHIECLINQADFDTTDIASVAKETAAVVMANMAPFLGELWPVDTSNLMVDPYDLNPLNQGADALQERVDFIYGTQETLDDDGNPIQEPVVDVINRTGDLIASAPLDALATDNGFVGPDSLGNVNTVSEYESIVTVVAEGGFAEYQGGDNQETGEKKFYCTKPLFDSVNQTTKLEVSCVDAQRRCSDAGGNLSDTAHVNEQACWTACNDNASFSGGTWNLGEGGPSITYGASVCVNSLSTISHFEGFSQLEACALNPETCAFGENVTCETRYFGNNSTEKCVDEADQVVSTVELDHLQNTVARVIYTNPITRSTDAYYTDDTGRSTEVLEVESVEAFIVEGDEEGSGMWRTMSGNYYDITGVLIKRSEFTLEGEGTFTEYSTNDLGESCTTTTYFTQWDTLSITEELCI